MPNIIGVISDTHGLLRPEALTALRGVEMILHAGDIGGPEILEELSKIARVVAVRGNNDKGGWAGAVPESQILEVASVGIYMLHDIKELAPSAIPAGTRVVISGHSHRPLVETREGVLYVNPGSAGPKRFSLPTTIAMLSIDGEVSVEIIHLLTDPTKRP